jgi:hypothetical protein
MVLQRANQLEARAVADVRQTRVAVSAEIPLVDAAIGRAIEDRAPAFQLAHAIGRFLRVQLRHPPVVHVLPAAHRVGEVDAPAVAIVVVGQGGGHPPLCHDGVRLAEERFADEADRHACACRFDGGAQSRATRADDQYVVVVARVDSHQRIR